MQVKTQNLRRLEAQNRMSRGEWVQMEGLLTVLSLAPDPSLPLVSHPPSLNPLTPTSIHGTRCMSKAPQQSFVMLETPPFRLGVLLAPQYLSPCPSDVVPLLRTSLQIVAKLPPRA